MYPVLYNFELYAFYQLFRMMALKEKIDWFQTPVQYIHTFECYVTSLGQGANLGIM